MMSLFIHQASSRGYCPSAPVTEASDLDKQQHFSHPDHVMVQVHIPHIFFSSNSGGYLLRFTAKDGPGNKTTVDQLYCIKASMMALGLY